MCDTAALSHLSHKCRITVKCAILKKKIHLVYQRGGKVSRFLCTMLILYVKKTDDFDLLLALKVWVSVFRGKG